MKNFSFKRLVQLIKKQWIESRRLYLLSATALWGILALALAFWIFSGGNNYNEEVAIGIGLFGLFITGGVFASNWFASYNDKQKGVYALSFPASSSEKLLCAVFFNVLVFTLFYFTSFLILKYFSDLIIEARVVANNDYSYNRINWQNSFAKSIPVFIYAFFIVQAIFALSSVVFKRFAFVTTAIIVIVLFFAWVFITGKIVSSIYTNNNFGFKFSEISEFVPSANFHKSYELPALLQIVLGLILKYLLAPFFWLVTYFKLKEKQI